MSLNALPTALLVPPANLVIAAAIGIATLRVTPRLGHILLSTSVAGLLILSLPVVANCLIVSLESPASITGTAPTAIIVFAGDIVETKTAIEIGSLTLERVRVGAELARVTNLPILVTGGTVGEGADTLGGLMARSLQKDFGVTPRWIERCAQDTVENAKLSADILVQAGVRSAYLVTHAWHMKRSLLAFTATSLAVTPAPVRLDRVVANDASAFIPRASALQASYYALHEWIGCLAVWLGLTRQ